MLSTAFGIIAALLGGSLWALIVVLTKYELGLIAWAIGGLTGFAVALAITDYCTKIHQSIAVAASLLGIILGKYFVFHYFFYGGLNQLFSSFSINLFSQVLPEFFGIMDIVFILFAIVSAWSIPARLQEQNHMMSTEELNELKNQKELGENA